jgi:hypothetical protein
MRIFFPGYDCAKGQPGDDVSIHKPYFELGWEVVTTHLDLKHLVATGRTCAQDLVVTASGREFLYRSQFPHVISYDAFQRMPLRFGDDVVALTDRYSDGLIPPDYFDTGHRSPDARYRHLVQDAAFIRSIDSVRLEALGLDDGYCCVAIRRRDHAPSRNLPESVIRRLLLDLAGEYRRVFVVGHGNTGLRSVPGVVPVDLASFASLISDPRCGLVLGTMTGPIQLACLIAQARVCVVITLRDDYDIEAENDPICAGRCVRLSESPFVFLGPSDFNGVLSAIEPGGLTPRFLARL